MREVNKIRKYEKLTKDELLSRFFNEENVLNEVVEISSREKLTRAELLLRFLDGEYDPHEELLNKMFNSNKFVKKAGD